MTQAAIYLVDGNVAMGAGRIDAAIAVLAAAAGLVPTDLECGLALKKAGRAKAERAILNPDRQTGKR